MKNAKQILQVFHWCGTLQDLKGTIAEHKNEVSYDIKTRNTIINFVLDMGYNVMLLKTKTGLMIGVDTKRFQQR